MTITCSERLSEAVRKAVEVDDLVEALISTEKDEGRRKELVKRRGKACRSLLECLGYRAYSDAQDNKNPVFLPDTEIERRGWGRVKASQLSEYDLPFRETVLTKDIAPHSLFFEEIYRDPKTHDTVTVYDLCWYVFPDGTSQEDADAIPNADLERLAYKEGYSRTFNREEAEAAKAAGKAVRPVYRQRNGMCGGIIFHQNYRDGKPDGTGSWSTHT